MAVGSIAAQTVMAGESVTVNVASNFTDVDMGDSLTYTAMSDDTAVATVSVSGSMVSITGVAAGSAMVTVTATDTRGAYAMQTIAVAVTMELMAPSNVRVNPVGSGIALVGWGSVAGAVGYALIATNLSDPSGETRTAAAARDATAGLILGLTVGDEYLIFVGAFNDQLEFELSEYVRITAE